MWLFSRKGSSGYSSISTAEEVTQGIDGSDLTAIVTGASSGIGAETARVLASRGVHVIMGVRNVNAGEKIKENILTEIPSAMIDIIELDLSSMASVKRFASKFNTLSFPLNILINNAGVAVSFELSEDKIEMQFATNHIGHFLLTNLLLDTMKKTSTESNIEGRIINVSSDAHQMTYSEGIRFDKINDHEGFSGMRSYGQSKLANILHSNELARRLKEEGSNITANSVHPGAIATNLYRSNRLVQGVVNLFGKYMLKDVRQGAATTCYVALHPQVKGLSGKYFVDSNLAKASTLANDTKMSTKLWDFSTNLVK